MAYKKYDRTWFIIGCHKGDMCYKMEVPSSIVAGCESDGASFDEYVCLFVRWGDSSFSAWMYASSPEEALDKAWKRWSEIHNRAPVPLEGFPAIATENILLTPESYDWCKKHLKGFLSQKK